jgi:hypothetical protein
MITPRVTEIVPGANRAHQSTMMEHAVQRDRVRASILAVPAEPDSRRPAKKPALFTRFSSR